VAPCDAALVTAPSQPTRRARALIGRLVLTGVVVAGGAALVPGLSSSSTSARDEPPLRPTPQIRCNEGSRTETSIQGRVPRRDYASGRAARGYTCNTRQVSRSGASGGFKTHHYRDRAGRSCVFYDSTRMAPTDLPYNLSRGGLGTFVVAMGDATRPRQTATLQTLANSSPHESLLLNRRRGLLVAVAGNAATLPGVIDVYSVKDNCRRPVLRASMPFQGFGHESGFAPDGRTFYASGTFSSLGQGGPALSAISLDAPSRPRVLATYPGVVYHGLRLSPDGNLMYVANIGSPTPGGPVATGGLRVLDVSEIQARKAAPRIRVRSDMTWRQMSIPQHADPLVINGHKYVLETDEFANFTLSPDLLLSGGYQKDAPVGAARLINVDNPRNPFVVSNLRLAVHQLANRGGPQQHDPGARSPIGGYTGHYCSAPRYRNPGIVACSMIGSGLRIFDVRDPYRPKEVGYFNRPSMPGERPNNDGGASAMSAPAYDLKRRLVFYTDSYKGLYAVRLAKHIVPRHYWR
jgi:hypothetical protein